MQSNNQRKETTLVFCGDLGFGLVFLFLLDGASVSDNCSSWVDSFEDEGSFELRKMWILLSLVVFCLEPETLVDGFAKVPPPLLISNVSSLRVGVPRKMPWRWNVYPKNSFGVYIIPILHFVGMVHSITVLFIWAIFAKLPTLFSRRLLAFAGAYVFPILVSPTTSYSLKSTSFPKPMHSSTPLKTKCKYRGNEWREIVRLVAIYSSKPYTWN